MRGIISLLASGNINKTKKTGNILLFLSNSTSKNVSSCDICYSPGCRQCALCLGRLCRAGTWLIILHISSYPRMLRPDCSARLAALQLLQSVPCDLWTNRSHRRGAGGITGHHSALKTHTDHHIAHNKKNLNNTQKSSSISCFVEQIYIVCRSTFHGIHMQVRFYISKIKANS